MAYIWVAFHVGKKLRKSFMRIFLIAAFIFGFSSASYAEQELPVEQMPPVKCQLDEDCAEQEDEALEELVICTMDAKICPDGSYVARQGPDCEFAPCPSEE